MRISILCSDPGHPINTSLLAWISRNGDAHEIFLARKRRDLNGGDILFLISCSEIIGTLERKAYTACLVIHASDLPRGRGWSPHVWQIIGGATQLTVTLLEAAEGVDSGAIWDQIELEIPRHELWSEINQRLFDAELALMDRALVLLNNVRPTPQAADVQPTYHPRRTSEDSRIDPDKSLRSQFDLIRVSDPHRYPAYLELFGHRYRIILQKMDVQRD